MRSDADASLNEINSIGKDAFDEIALALFGGIIQRAFAGLPLVRVSLCDVGGRIPGCS